MDGMQFSPEIVDMALNQLSSPDIDAQLESLSLLGLSLISVSPDEIGSYGIERVVNPVIELFKTSESDFIAEQAALCIRNLLSNSTDAIFPIARAGFIQAAKEKLDNGFSIELAENVIHCFNSIANYTASTLSKIIGIDIFFKFLDFMTIAEQRTSLQTVAVMTEYYQRSDYVNFLPNLCSLTCQQDNRIAKYCINAIGNIIKEMDLDDFPIADIESLSTAITTTTSSDLVYDILIILIRLTDSKKCTEAIAKTNIPYDRLLFSKDFPDSRLDIIQRTLFLFSQLLPRPNYPENILLDEHDAPESALEFSRKARELLIRHIIENNNNELLAISNLTACLMLEQFEIPSQVFVAISGHANKTDNACIVLEFALNVEDKAKTSLYGISDTLSRVKPSNKSNLDWYQEKLAKLQESVKGKASSICEGKTFDSFADIVAFINENSFSSAEFFSSGLAKQFHQLAKKTESAEGLDLKPSYKLFEEIATFLPVYEERDPLEGQPLTKIPFIGYNFKLKLGDDVYKTPDILMTSMFICLEFWFNISIRNYSVEDLLKLIQSNPVFAKYLDLRLMKSFTWSQLGLLCRILRPPNYKFYAFELDGTRFSALAECFTSISRLCSSLKEVFDGNVVVNLVEIDLDNDAPLQLNVKHEKITGEMNLALNCLKDLQKLINPKSDMKSAKLETRMNMMLQSPVLSMSFFSPAMAIIRKCPFLFSEQLKFYIFQIASLDLFSSLLHSSKVIMKSNEKFTEGRVTFSCTVSRESLFEDGLAVLNNFGPGPSHLVIGFQGEAGYGSGPLREFLNLMSREFMKKSLNMWRNEDPKSEFAFTKDGLFPSPAADKKLFRTLGVLFGKALASDVVLPIPLSNNFLRLVLGDSLTVSEVDKMLDKSLNSDKTALYGLPFTYPGIDNIELVPGGSDKEVNAENVDEYRKLVEEFTVRGNVLECALEFKKGFSSVVPSPMWDLLNSHELLHLLTGSEVSLSFDDLVDSIDVEHGFTKNSPQISMLFKLIVKMPSNEQSLFVKFVTGSERLPIGGLGSLQPRISIARKTPEGKESADWLLPSVSTCSHYLKIPPYSTIEVMREKLLYAIYEGQDAFLLT